MLSAALSSPTSPSTTHLYDLVATSDGIHVSPNCVDGHILVMELIQRLGLADQIRVSGMDSGSAGRGPKGDWNGSALPLLSPSATLPPAALSSLGSERRETPSTSQGPNTVLLSTTPDAGSTPASPARVPVTDEVLSVPAPSSGKRLSEMVALNLANLARGPKKATPATRDRRYILTLLLDVLGDKPVADITAEDANAMADVLASWPRYQTHYPDLKGLPARTVAALTKKKQLPTIQRSTQGKHLMALNAFFNWCAEAKTIPENPFHYVDNARYRDKVPKKRDIFSAQDLQAIFAPKHVGQYSEPHKYWVPLIGLFTGMRVNEISQLYVDDIQTDIEVDEDGVEHAILYFDITPFREGQSIKTGYSMRRMPVPARLLELGFERYVADVRASGSKHFFPGLHWVEGGPGRTTSRWFNKHHLRNACGITSAKKSLHCFRHTLTTRCERAHVPKSIIQTINGHSDGQGVDARTYVARGSLLECKRALDGVKYPPLDLVPYTSERFAAYLAQAAAQTAHTERLGEEGKPVVSRKGRRPKFALKTHQLLMGEGLTEPG
jgi:integrase